MKRKSIIAFVGTDGSGKTTVMNAVLPELEKSIGAKFIVHHLKPDFLPPLGRFRGVKHEEGYVCTNPHGSKPSGCVGSLIRLVYLTLDYILGYWLKVCPAIRDKSCAGWVFDRYAYDMCLDPLRFRIKLPSSIIRFVLRLIPEPDLVICLGGDANKIHARKPEISIEEVVQQIEVLKSLCKKNSRMHWVDTTVSLEETILRVKNLLKEALS